MTTEALTPEQQAAERFARDTARHQMTVLHDDGLYRHLRFKSEHGFMWFDLITVPHALIFRGDGTSFVFSRLEDMFQFFRSGIRRDGSIHIESSYWAEKLTSDRDSVMTYSQDILQQRVAEELAEAETEWPGVTAAWKAATEGDWAEYNLEYLETAHEALRDFSFGEPRITRSCSCGATGEFDNYASAITWESKHLRDVDDSHKVTEKREEHFYLDGWEEWQLKDYHWWFLWALHGIVWGIAQYDAHRAAATVPAEAAAR